MNKTMIGVGLAMICLTVKPPLHAQPENLSTYTTQNAYAWFAANDPSDETGCTALNALVSVSTNVVKVPGQPTRNPASLYLFMMRHNNCTGETYMYSEANPTVAEFTMSENSVRLKAEGEIFNYMTQSTVAVTVEVTWSLTGWPSSATGMQHAKDIYGNITNSRYVQRYCLADALGSIVAEGINYTPEVAADANYGMNTSQSLLIRR